MLHTILLFSLAFSQNPMQVNNDLVIMRDIEYAPVQLGQNLARPLLMDVAFPTVTKGALPAIIFVHGRGWKDGDRNEGLQFIKLVAEGGYFAATIDYRLTAEAGFPAAVHDCKAAVKFLRTNAESLGIDECRIGIVGVSAGGHLAALVGLSAGDKYLDGDFNGGDVSTDVTCIGSISGAVMPQNQKGNGKRLYEAWALQDKSVKLELTLPQHYLDKLDPPIYLLCGEKDTICPLKDTQSFIQYLERDGVSYETSVVPNKGHQITEPTAYVGLASFLDKHLGGHAETALKEGLAERKKSGRSRD